MRSLRRLANDRPRHRNAPVRVLSAFLVGLDGHVDQGDLATRCRCVDSVNGPIRRTLPVRRGAFVNGR